MEDEDPAECDSCHAKEVKLETYTQGIGVKKHDVQLCELCANTYAGNALEYPEQYPAAILKAICFVGNEILKELRKRS